MLIKRKRIPIKQIITIGLLPSWIKRVIYRLKGYKIGKKVSFGIGSIIVGKKVTIGDYSKLGFLSVIRAKKVYIGRYVKIGAVVFIDTEDVHIDDDARINEQVIIGGLKSPESSLKIGKRVIIMEYSFINPTKPIIIGDDTGIGGHCLLFTHGSWLSQLEGFPVTFAPISLGKNVWLPWRIFILPGVTIGDNVVIGANSLVNKSLPSNCLAAGSPIRIISENYPSPLSDEKRETVLNDIVESFVNYLNYYDYDTNKSEIENGFQLKIRNRKKVHYLYYLKEHSHPEIASDRDVVVVLDYFESDDVLSIDRRNLMKLNIREKTRVGSSRIGEEYTAFLSRYGIRFDRLD